MKAVCTLLRVLITLMPWIVVSTSAQRWNEEDLLDGTSVNLRVELLNLYPDLSDIDGFNWAQFSIQDPEAALNLVEAGKSQDERLLDEWKKLAILDPIGYREAWEASFGPIPDWPEAQAQRKEARWAILNPREAEKARQETASEDDLRKWQVAQFAILNPKEFNQLVSSFKSPVHLDAETLADQALSDPAGFLEELSKRQQEMNNPADSSQKGAANE